MVALYTMAEILVAIDNPDIAKNMHMTSDPELSKFPEDLVIKIKHDLDENHLRIIEPIVAKRNLKIEKLKDALVIY
jgi:hypothetical protein